MITKFKIFENNSNNSNNSWIINITNSIDTKTAKELSDIRDDVREGDVVIGVWFSGDFDPFLLKVEDLSTSDDPELGLGVCDDHICYTLEHAWGVFDPDEYDKLADKKLPYSELRDGTITYSEWEESNKYNL